jgi:hypothetical protein
MPTSMASTYAHGRGRAGTVALWMIELIRLREASAKRPGRSTDLRPRRPEVQRMRGSDRSARRRGAYGNGGLRLNRFVRRSGEDRSPRCTT